jgi:glycerophosphoryl diester phosphodiesterase
MSCYCGCIGACGYVPEHSLPSHQMAIDLGTDYIEPDLCLSKDLVLMVLHDSTLDETTNVRDHPEFSDRETDGKFYVYDFTMAELKTLRLRQRVSDRTTLYNDIFTMPTFSEVLDLVWENYEKSEGWMIGVYPELKNPAHTNSLFNVSMEQMVLDELQAHGYELKGVSQDLNLVQPVLLQSKEEESLRILKTLTDIPLLQLMNSGYQWSDELLGTFSEYAQGVGPDKAFFYGAGVSLDTARGRVQSAHDLGLVLHPYTFRREATYVAAQFHKDPDVEAAYFYCCLGIDAVFTEFPDRIRQTIYDMGVSIEEVCSLGGC